MNKAELIDAIAASSKLTKADAGRALDSTIEAINKALKKGDRIGLVGFGSFSVSKRAARTGRNPQTGKEIKIAAKKVVKFKAGADLANLVNKGKVIQIISSGRAVPWAGSFFFVYVEFFFVNLKLRVCAISGTVKC